jgi:hypothetical protein
MAMPTVAIQNVSKDAAALSRKSEQDRFFDNMEAFAELDKAFRFQLMGSKDDQSNPEIFDHKTGTLIQAPQASDRGMDALRKLAVYRYAYDQALQHRSASWELQRNLRAEQSNREHAEFDNLMKMAGYVRDSDGELQPTEAKAKELIHRNPQLAMNGLFGKGWKDGK